MLLLQDFWLEVKFYKKRGEIISPLSLFTSDNPQSTA